MNSRRTAITWCVPLIYRIRCTNFSIRLLQKKFHWTQQKSNKTNCCNNSHNIHYICSSAISLRLNFTVKLRENKMKWKFDIKLFWWPFFHQPLCALCELDTTVFFSHIMCVTQKTIKEMKRERGRERKSIRNVKEN